MRIRDEQRVCMNDIEESTFVAERGCAQMVYISAKWRDMITKK